MLLQRYLHWFGDASRRDPGEVIREVICTTPLPTWRKCRGPNDDLFVDNEGRLRAYGLRRWNGEWPSICIDMAQDRRVWSAIVRDAISALQVDQSDQDDRRLKGSERRAEKGPSATHRVVCSLHPKIKQGVSDTHDSSSNTSLAQNRRV